MNNPESATMQRTVAWIEPSAFPMRQAGKKRNHLGPPSIYDGVMMPRAGAAMTAVLAEHGYRTVVISGELTPLVPAEIAAIGKIVCISTLSNSAPHSLVLAKQLQQLGCTVIMGGYHFAQQVMTEQSLAPTAQALSFCDYVIRGEGYDALPELLQALKGQRHLQEVGGLSWRDASGIHHNPTQSTRRPLDQLPMPDLSSLVDADKSTCAGAQGQQGCPRACTWCAVTARDGQGGPKCRRAPTQFVAEIEQALHQLPNVAHLFVTADNLVVQVEWLKQVCQEIGRRRIRLPWSCQAETPTLARHADLSRLMFEAGCARVCLGLESVSEKALTDSDKARNVDTMAQAVQNAHKAGIAVHGMFIVGLAGDGEVEVESALQWCYEHGVETAQFLCLMGLPGSKLTEKDGLLQEAFRPFQGALAPLNWLFMNGHFAQLSSDTLDLAAVQELSLSATTEFYRLRRVISALLRPKINVWRAARRHGASITGATGQMIWSQIVTAALRWRGYSKTRAWKEHPLTQAYRRLLAAQSRAEREQALDAIVRTLPQDWLDTFDLVWREEHGLTTTMGDTRSAVI